MRKRFEGRKAAPTGVMMKSTKRDMFTIVKHNFSPHSLTIIISFYTCAWEGSINEYENATTMGVRSRL